MAPVKGPGRALGLKQGLLGGGGTREQADLCVPAQRSGNSGGHSQFAEPPGLEPPCTGDGDVLPE